MSSNMMSAKHELKLDPHGKANPVWATKEIKYYHYDLIDKVTCTVKVDLVSWELGDALCT